MRIPIVSNTFIIHLSRLHIGNPVAVLVFFVARITDDITPVAEEVDGSPFPFFHLLIATITDD